MFIVWHQFDGISSPNLSTWIFSSNVSEHRKFSIQAGLEALPNWEGLCLDHILSYKGSAEDALADLRWVAHCFVYSFLTLNGEPLGKQFRDEVC